MKAKDVLRWLLYKPGLEHPYDFGLGEMIFSRGRMSDSPEVTVLHPDLFLWKVNRTYRNQNRRHRNDVCLIVRQGKSKLCIPENEAQEANQIDGMSHAEINGVFNRCRVFYSDDETTMYSQHAAVAVCAMGIVSELYSSREEWVRNHELARYGVAYGPEDIRRAKATNDKVLTLLEAEEVKGRATVDQFVTFTRERFARTSKAK